MTLNLEDVSKNPDSLTQEIVLNSGMKVMLRPLDGSDIHLLADFLEQLTPATREYYVLTSYDTTMAKELCNAIGRYNKLRLVVEDISETRIIALFETSFDITDQEMERFQNYGIALDSKTDCRMGPCIADDFQSLGLGSKVFPHLLETAHLFKKKRMIIMIDFVAALFFRLTI